ARRRKSTPGATVGRLLFLDTMTYLPLHILTKVEGRSMGPSLEGRPPLLDTPLVEALASLPSEWKVRGGERKILLKEAVRDLVPRPILERAKKGFGVPIGAWFRGPLRSVVPEVLLDRRTVQR